MIGSKNRRLISRKAMFSDKANIEYDFSKEEAIKVTGEFIDSNKAAGFIILRYVNSNQTNTYWIRCYTSIRKYYPSLRIVIIDDHSDPKYLTDESLINTLVVQSRYKGRGELLPYYLLIENSWFDKAIFIHDSIFINKPIDLNIDKFQFLWNFENRWDKKEAIKKQISCLKNHHRVLEVYETLEDIGCFGGMSIIERDFLLKINEEYEISNLLRVITDRNSRMDFERVLGCMLLSVHKPTEYVKFGNIMKYQSWGRKFENLSIRDRNLDIVKYWTGR